MKSKWKWKCPYCRHLHIWEWDIFEIPYPGDPPFHVKCEKCNTEMKMQSQLVELAPD